MLVWVKFIALATAGYIGIAIFNRLVGGDTISVFDAMKTALKPLPLTVMIVANVTLAGAVYFGFLATNSAVPVMLSLGVLVTFVYSVLTLGVAVTLAKLLGVALIIAGIYLLR